jgi:hypothetical protein
MAVGAAAGGRSSPGTVPLLLLWGDGRRGCPAPGLSRNARVMSTQVRDLLDYFTGDPSAVDDYLANQSTSTGDDDRADHQREQHEGTRARTA